MPPPPRDTRGKPSLDRQRKPTEIDVYDEETGRISLSDVGPGTVETPPDSYDANENKKLLDRMVQNPTKQTRKRRKLTQVALGLFTSGMSVPDIADQLGVSPVTLARWFATHRQEALVEQIDTILDQTAVPLATSNLVAGLLAGDKDYTLETLKGRGKLKRHSEGDGKPQTELPALVIKFEKEDPAFKTTRVVGHGVVGALAVPKQLPGRQAEDEKEYTAPDIVGHAVKVE